MQRQDAGVDNQLPVAADAFLGLRLAVGEIERAPGQGVQAGRHLAAMVIGGVDYPAFEAFHQHDNQVAGRNGGVGGSGVEAADLGRDGILRHTHLGSAAGIVLGGMVEGDDAGQVADDGMVGDVAVGFMCVFGQHHPFVGFHAEVAPGEDVVGEGVVLVSMLAVEVAEPDVGQCDDGQQAEEEEGAAGGGCLQGDECQGI